MGILVSDSFEARRESTSNQGPRRLHIRASTVCNYCVYILIRYQVFKLAPEPVYFRRMYWSRRAGDLQKRRPTRAKA